MRLPRAARVLATLLDNGPDFIALDEAAAEAGIVHVPLPLFFTPAQRQHALQAAGVDTLVTAAGVERLPFAAKPMPAGTSKITFTSGTTGTPKGVCLSARAMDAVADGLIAATAGLGISRHLNALPFAVLLENIAGVLAPRRQGVTVISPTLADVGLTGSSGFDPARLHAAVLEHRAESAEQARARVDWLRAELQAQRKGGSQRPALQLGVKREDFDQLAPPLDSVGIGFAVPLGRGRDNAVTVEQTSQALLEAEVAAQVLQRELKEELHDVRHQINIIERHMSDSGALLEIAQQVLAMEQLANRQGEITVIEVLRAGQGLAEARQRHAVLTLQRQALTARYNQAVGELPR